MNVSGDFLSRRQLTAGLGLTLLIFLQLVTAWIEHIYRVSILSREPGLEMLGLLAVLTPLLLWLVPLSWSFGVSLAAWLLMLLARVVFPELSLVPTLVVCSMGVGAGLVHLCSVLNGTSQASSRQLGQALGLAVLMSVVLRSWGASLDISTTGPWRGLGLLLAVLCLVCTWRSKGNNCCMPTTARPGWRRSVCSSLGLFACFQLAYFVLLSPAVVSAWSGAHWPTLLALLVVSWVVFPWALDRWPVLQSTPVLLLLNVMWLSCLVGGQLLHAPQYPTLPESAAFVEVPFSDWRDIPLYLMCALSPVLMANVIRLTGRTHMTTVRHMAVPVCLGMSLLVMMVLIAIFTNTWGYMKPIGVWLRGHFWLPYLIGGGVMTLAVLLTPEIHSRDRRSHLLGLPAMLALLAMAGVLVPRTSAGSGAAEKRSLTVVSYNMQFGSCLTGEENLHEQLRLLRVLDADVIGLQESDTARPSCGNIDAARFFAEQLGYHYYFGPSTVGGTFGTAILSRYPLQKVRSIYSFSDRDETATAVAEIEAGGRRIAVLNSHPAGKRPSRQAHVDALLQAAKEYEHVIAVGDYNFRQDSSYYADVTGPLTDCWRTLHPDGVGVWPDVPGFVEEQAGQPLDMNRRIDHTFVTDTFQVDQAHYLPRPMSQTDHPAHWTVLSW